VAGQLGEIVRRVWDGRLRTIIGKVAPLDDAVAAFDPTERVKGKTIIRVRPQGLRDAPGGRSARRNLALPEQQDIAR
jgi:hypothetical protein